jgi:hypothetical protein
MGRACCSEILEGPPVSQPSKLQSIKDAIIAISVVHIQS